MSAIVLRSPDPTVFASMAGSMVVDGRLTPSRQKWFWRRPGKSSMILTIPVGPLPTQSQTASSAALDTLDAWKAAY